MDLNKTGLFISALRKQNGLTQKELAEKIGVTDKAVSRWKQEKDFLMFLSLSYLRRC